MEPLTSPDLVVAEKQAITTDPVRLVLRHSQGRMQHLRS